MNSDIVHFYFIAGFLLLTNIGTIVAVFKDKIKESYEKGAKDKEIEKNFEAHMHKIDKAHERIDRMKEKYESQ